MAPKAKGEAAEGIVLGRLLKLGRIVLIPFGNNQRYDLVVDSGDGRFVRGQCKSAVYRDGAIVFAASSLNSITRKRKNYRGQIEVFWVYCAELDRIYEVPVDSVCESHASLRVEPPKNGASKNIRWASDFELPTK